MKRALYFIISGLSLFMLTGCGAKQQTSIEVLAQDIEILQVEIEGVKKALYEQEGQLIALGILKERNIQIASEEITSAPDTLPPLDPLADTLVTSDTTLASLTPEDTLVKESISTPDFVPTQPVSASLNPPVNEVLPSNVVVPEQNISIASLPSPVISSPATTPPVSASILTPTERVAQQTTPVVFKEAPIDTAGVESLKSLTELQAYEKALSFYRTGKFIEAEKAFDLFLELYPESRYSPNALYWKGESFYARAMYPEAIMSFKDVQARFPQHIKTADALLKTALSYKRLQDDANAALHTTVLYEDWPNSDAAQRGKALNLITL